MNFQFFYYCNPKADQFFVMSQLCIHENGKNPNTGSQDIVWEGKCHANANANDKNQYVTLPLGLGT